MAPMPAEELLDLRPPAGDEGLSRLYDSRPPAPEPGLAYAAAYERRFGRYRSLFDFVGARDHNGRLKAFERDLYLHHLGPHLVRLASGARLIDAGCGVGRFLEAWLSRGLVVEGVDASASALKAAARRARAWAGQDRLRLRLRDVRRLGCPDAAFDAGASLEVVCYLDHPEDGLRELARALKPGAPAFVSVEGRAAPLSDGRSGLEQWPQAWNEGRLQVEDYRVRYFSDGELRQAMEAAGFDVLEVIGTHYVPEGPLDRLVDEAALTDPERRERLMALELECARDPLLAPLARCWLAVGRRRNA